MRKIAAGVAAASAVALAAGALAPAAMAADDGTKSLAAVLTAETPAFDKNWNDYDIVTAAVLAVLDAKPNSPVGVLAKGDVALTAFIPSDKAFRTLVKDLTGKKPTTEAKTFAAVAGLGGIDLVETVLLYHVVPGATIDAATALKANGAYLETGVRAIRVKVVKGSQVRLQDADSNSRNARVNVVNINQGNKQIAHGIDRVMRPLDLPPLAK
jgi:Fasciclin domain